MPKASATVRVAAALAPWIFPNPRGAGDIEIDKSGGYVSIDIGVTTDDRQPLQDGTGGGVIGAALASTVDLLRGLEDQRLAGADFVALDEALRLLRQRHAEAIG